MRQFIGTPAQLRQPLCIFFTRDHFLQCHGLRHAERLKPESAAGGFADDDGASITSPRAALSIAAASAPAPIPGSKPATLSNRTNPILSRRGIFSPGRAFVSG
jgi:hypothetical protein